LPDAKLLRISPRDGSQPLAQQNLIRNLIHREVV